MIDLPETRIAKAHVNLMTDTVIANLPPEALRSVMRSILTTDPGFTGALECHTRRYLLKTSPSFSIGELFTGDASSGLETTVQFTTTQQRIRVMLGSGLCFEGLGLLGDIIDKCRALRLGEHPPEERLLQSLVSVDGDIVQALTAVEKKLTLPSGRRDLAEDESRSLTRLVRSLLECRKGWRSQGQNEFVFERSLGAVADITSTNLDLEDGRDHSSSLPRGQGHVPAVPAVNIPPPPETFDLQGTSLPRLFCGLWQLSSPSWGIASKEQISRQFSRFLSKGFVAYDMADHYGDAEVLFGSFRASTVQADAIFGATKLCIFQPTTITETLLRDNVTERCRRMSSSTIDLLQFHWQFYDDPQYIKALRILQADDRIRFLGLCNFDTLRLEEILGAGIKIATNQVQFSLVDSRPTIKMGRVCQENNVKLLTYGTLCGGFLADKWLGQPEPELFSDRMTPSQRKYFEMIVAWGGWSLFQQLLTVLKAMADKYQVGISNVATRWVLDFPYVGAVIVGTRMGVSEHSDQNLDTYGWHLDEEDQKSIETILSKSRRKEMFNVMDDCGGEYR
ncbi:hypothetical protein LTS17_008414 [Exophiala oligosperma]